MVVNNWLKKKRQCELLLPFPPSYRVVCIAMSFRTTRDARNYNASCNSESYPLDVPIPCEIPKTPGISGHVTVPIRRTKLFVAKRYFSEQARNDEPDHVKNHWSAKSDNFYRVEKPPSENLRWMVGFRDLVRRWLTSPNLRSSSPRSSNHESLNLRSPNTLFSILSADLAKWNILDQHSPYFDATEGSSSLAFHPVVVWIILSTNTFWVHI